MIALPIALAAAVVAWGQPVLPRPTPAETAAPAEAVAPEPPPAAVPMIAPGGVDVSVLTTWSSTVVVSHDVAPAKARRLLYKDWRFWTIAGSLFVATIATTYAVTRPEPPVYTGNAPPFSVSFK